MKFPRSLAVLSMMIVAAAGLLAKGDVGRAPVAAGHEWRMAPRHTALPSELTLARVAPAATEGGGGGASADGQCGGPYQRACCALETGYVCQDGMMPVANCDITDPGCKCSNSVFATLFACYPAVNQIGVTHYGANAYTSPSPCGGDGQRACNVGERIPECNAPLFSIPGCAGDCSGYDGSVSTRSCISNGNTMISEPTTGRATEADASGRPPVAGFADLHLHLFAETAHGGGVLAGRAYNPDSLDGGVNEALAPDYGTDKDIVAYNNGTQLGWTGTCPDGLSFCGSTFLHKDHDLFEDPIGNGTYDGAHSNFGAPYFNGWPQWSSTTHQQAYYEWLKRAWQGGMRLTTMLAVTNSTMCKGNKKLANTDCNDSMAEIDTQITAFKNFVTWVETYDPDRGWLEIALTPVAARNIIARGHLAVVIGIEVDNLFNCSFPADHNNIIGEIQDVNFGADVSDTCNPDQIATKLQAYYDLGIRHIFPIHNFDNAYGAPATWNTGIEFGNRVSEGHWWDVRNCPSGYSFLSHVGTITNQISWMTRFLGTTFALPEMSYEDNQRSLNGILTSCNKYGVFPLGTSLMTKMMDLGMIIDVDHMSIQAFNDTMDLTEQRTNKAGSPSVYPVVATHVLSADMHVSTDHHERMRTKAQLQRIRDDGGMIAAMLKDDVQDSSDAPNPHAKVTVPYGTSVVDDCQQSSKSFAQAYMYAVDTMQGPVAFGSDFNGIAAHIGPRFGHDGCGGNEAVFTDARAADRAAQYVMNGRQKTMKNPLVYPFTNEFGTFDRQVTGMRTFDYNIDGLAHVGLLPDLVADLNAVGMPNAYQQSIMQSAEAYIRVWERAWAASLNDPLDETDVPSSPKIGSIIASPNPARTTTPVQFSQSQITAQDGGTYTWNFGDGTMATGPTPQHVFALPGSYSVSVSVAGRPAYTGATTTVGVEFGTPPLATLSGSTSLRSDETGHYILEAFATNNDPVTLTSLTCGSGNLASQQPYTDPTLIAQPAVGIAFDCQFPPGASQMIVSATVHDIDGDTARSITVARVFGTPPNATLTGPDQLTPGTSHAFNIQGNATDDDPVSLVGLDCGAGTLLSRTGNGGAAPNYSEGFICQQPAASQPYMVVTATLHDVDGNTTKRLIVYNGSAPTVNLNGPTQSTIGRKELYYFTAHSDHGGTITLVGANCGANGAVAGGPAITSQGVGDTEFGVLCLFTGKDPADIVSVTFNDDLGNQTIGKLSVSIVGTPPTGTIEGPTALTPGQTGHYVVHGRNTESDVVSVTALTCNGASVAMTTSRPNALDIDASFDCQFPASGASIQIQATLHDSDGDTPLASTVFNGNPPTVTLTGPAQSSINTVGFFAFSAHSDSGSPLTLQPATCGANGQIAGGPAITSVGLGDTQYAVLCRFTARDSADAVTVTFTDAAGRIGSKTMMVAITGNPPSATLTGETALAGGATGHYTVQGTATDNDPVTLTSVSCGTDPSTNQSIPPTNQSIDADPGINLTVTFDCMLGVGSASMDVTATLHDVDGDTTQTINVVNDGTPAVTMNGPTVSRIGSTENYYFSATSQDSTQPTLGPASCGQGNTIIGPAITSYDTESGYTEFGIRCTFHSKNPATTVSVSFVDSHQHTGVGAVVVNVAGLPPAATLTGPMAPTSSGVNHYVVVGTATEGNPVSLVNVSCGSGTLSGQQPNSIASPNLSVAFDCAFPNGPLSPTITATVADEDGQTPTTIAATVVDTTPPVVKVNGSANPAAIVAPGTSSQGATVTFTLSATDNFGGTVTPSCSPASGSIFPFNDTTVVCTATDAAQNVGSAIFTVTVTDTHPPTIDPRPNLTIEAAGPNGAVANYVTPASHDDLSGNGVATCVPVAGALFPIGHTTVACNASDFAGNNAAPVTFDVFVHDTTPPTVTVPADIVVEATGPSGAPVTFSASASDTVSGPLTPFCTRAPGTFGVGTTPVTCSATDGANNTGSATFNVIVRDTGKPSVTVPADIVVEATGPSGASVTFSASASDTVSGALTPSCTKASPSTFGLGTTAVTCSATDASNNTASASFNVTVRDTTKPSVTVPADMVVEATGPSGASVSFTASATDIVSGPLTPSCTRAPGTFGVGTTPVTCSATDGSNNTGSASFSVIVRDTTPPSVTVPANMVVEATGPSGAPVSFAASASDIVSGPLTPSCTKPSPSTFGIGTTPVTCSATDGSYNTGSASFNVVVRDTTPPAIDAHASITVTSTGPAGAAVSYTPPASRDAVGGNGVAACTPVSGSTFAIGTTPVTCLASDAAGNHGSSTFLVTVNPTGNFTVGPGQTVVFNGGTIGHNVDLNGGTLILTQGTQVNGNLTVTNGTISVSNSTISGNLQFNNGGSFTLGPGTVITGNLQVQHLSASTTVNTMCGVQVNNDLQFQNNDAPVTIGSPAGCAGNAVSGNLQLQNNTAPIQVFGNHVQHNLQCGGNATIAGGSNAADKKQGQCTSF